MRYSAIIFDLDGTLLNTIDDLANSMNIVLEQHGFPVHPVEKYKYFVGNGMDNLTKRVLPTECTDEDFIKSFLDEFQNQYSQNWHSFTKPYPGIEKLLEGLEARGIKMSVLSNKADQFTQIIIDYFFGLNHFDFVLGAKAGVPKKPDPLAALEIARNSQIQPSEYLYLGDSGVDMQTANAAGMYALGATWGFRDVDELNTNGAKKLIYDPIEIIELFKNIGGK
jgi:phosphoglycolate phosphatase